MAEKRILTCKEGGCGKPFEAFPPDNEHKIPKTEQTEDSVMKSYKCPNGHTNEIFWARAGPSTCF